MKLGELLQQPAHLERKFSQYQRATRPSHMPPLDVTKLKLHGILGGAISMPTEGGNTLLLSYKGRNGGVVSAAELEGGKVWNMLQVQGSKSRNLTESPRALSGSAA